MYFILLRMGLIVWSDLNTELELFKNLEYKILETENKYNNMIYFIKDSGILEEEKKSVDYLLYYGIDLPHFDKLIYH